MLELFGVLFITLFIAFLLTLVVLNLDMMFKKGRVEKLETVNPAILELIELGKGFGSTIVSAPTRKEIDENIRKLFDKQRSKDRSVYTRHKQKHEGTIEFIACKWDEDRKEINETQVKYLETVPSHKTRVKNRNKRQRKK